LPLQSSLFHFLSRLPCLRTAEHSW
jgi:hypothetical protein